MNCKADNNPLVSIAVITYNSSNYVIETLESIKAQTYQNIELIISDDGSTDGTIKKCKEWLQNNSSRFINCRLVTVPQNTGTAANCNRAENICSAEWVKIIAGDDALLPNCISDCIEYISKNPDTIYLFGELTLINNTKIQKENTSHKAFFELSPNQQLEQLIYNGCCIPAVTAFYNKSKVLSLDINYDERIPLIEDWPRWINLLNCGVKFSYIDKELVKYRIGGISTQNRDSVQLYEMKRLMEIYYLLPERLKRNNNDAILKHIHHEVSVYRQLYTIQQSYAYQFSTYITYPLLLLKKMLRIIKDSISE